MHNPARAIRYRQLALGESDRAKAEMLYNLADEAERNVLCTSDWMRERWGGPWRLDYRAWRLWQLTRVFVRNLLANWNGCFGRTLPSHNA
jgi:hypothetical protein